MFEFSILRPYHESARIKKGSQTTKVLAKTIKIRVKYENMFFDIKNILAKNKLIILLILVGVFLRFYKLGEFATFLGDQGRDAIIIKRIVTFEHFPAIGPISSIGQVFLGPFYYYLMAPFLAITKLNPIGLAYGSALLAIIGFICAYLVIRKEINKTVAGFFLFLLIFSAVQVEASRFSWNPNLLPIFSFFTLYFLYKAITAKKYLWSILFGTFLALSIQLHYLAMFLLVPSLIFFILHDKNFWQIGCLKRIFVSLLTFLFFSSPLIIFDLKHNFLNVKNFIKVFTEQNVVAYSTPLSRLLTTNNAFFSHVFNLNLNTYVTFLIFLALVFYFYKNNFFKGKLFLQLNFLNFFFYILSFSLLNSNRLAHYYTQIYLSFFLVIACLFADFAKVRLLKFIVFIFLLIYVFLNVPKYPFYHKEGNFQIWRAKMIAQSIIEKNPQSPYQVVPIPFTEMDGHIRYFLEIMDKRPLSEESSDQPKELYILCYEKECDALNHPQWQIAAFISKKVEKTWKIDRVKIYKLVHGK